MQLVQGRPPLQAKCLLLQRTHALSAFRRLPVVLVVGVVLALALALALVWVVMIWVVGWPAVIEVEWEWKVEVAEAFPSMIESGRCWWVEEFFILLLPLNCYFL